MTPITDTGDEQPVDSKSRRAAQRIVLVFVLVVLTFGLPVAASSTSIFSTLGTKVAAAAIDNPAYPWRFDRVVKPWQCIDPDNGWYGPRRWTRSGAYIDCESYNGRAR